MNLIIHTNHGGSLRVEIEPYKITMEAYDDVPGIVDIEKAMQTGYSTAPHEIEKWGLALEWACNINRCVDEMRLISSRERGTNLYMIMYLNENNETKAKEE